MVKHRRWLAAAAAVGALAPAAAAEAAETVYGVTPSNRLVTFSSDSPGSVAPGLPIAGLQAGESVAGIDVRPATGDLTALGSTGRLYLVDPVTARAAPIEGAAPLALTGTRFGVDFNPLADALRIVSDTGQNLRVPQGGTGTAVTDAGLNPGTPGVTAAAYSNSFRGTTATTLFDVDSATDRLARQVPPNDGTLVDVGALGVDISGDAAFDIAPSDGAALLAARVAGAQGSTLFTVDLATGAATAAGAVGTAEPLRAIAVARQAPLLFALAGGTTLVTTRSAAPLDALRTVTITGTGGAELEGIDVRPATGELIGLGADGRVYALDPRTGRAVSRTGTPAALSGTAFGVDFNPVPDALRVVSDAEQNLRIPAGGTGTVVVDDALNPGDPQVAGAAYLNPFAGATATRLYDVDIAGADRLVVQDPPNDGTLAAVGPTGLDVVSDDLGFDIAPQDNAAFLAADAGTGPALYRVNRATGAASVVGALPFAGTVRGLAVAGAGSVGLTATAYAAKEGSDIQLGVLRSGGKGTVTVNWSVEGIASGALTFAPGETLKTIAVPNPDDAQPEAARTAAVTLSRAAGGYRLGTAAATLAIADDDPAPAPAPGPATPPAADRDEPVVLLVARDLRLRTLRANGVQARFSCNEACRVAARLTLGKRVVGRATASLSAPGVSSVRVRLSARGRRIVGTRKTRTLRVRAEVRDAAGNRTRVRSTFRARKG